MHRPLSLHPNRCYHWHSCDAQPEHPLLNPKRRSSLIGENFLRRLLVFCAVIFLFAMVIGGTQRNSAVAIAASPSTTDTSSIVSPSRVTVVATGISARALATDPSDSTSLYVSDATFPNRIFTVSIGNSAGSAGIHRQVIAGTGTGGSLGDGGSATSAQLDLSENFFAERSSVVAANDGTIYIADSGNSTIRTISGAASSEPGVIRSAVGRWAGQQTVTLVAPLALALDTNGDLFIADRTAGVIVRLSATGAEEVLAQISSPSNLAVTSDGTRVFVSSETGAVFQVDVQTHAVNSLPAFTPNASEGAGCESSNDASVTTLCPSGVAADSLGNLFVSSLNSGRVLRLNAQTGSTSVFASGLKLPGALAIGANNTLYVAEQGTNRIVAFAQAGISQGALSLTPASASFGNEPSGGVTATQAFTVSNVSGTVITGLSIPKTTSPADFTVQANSCTITLPANSNCNLSIAFTPTTTGARSDTLVVTDANSADSASTVLNGVGDDYQLQLANGQLSSVSIQAGAAATFNLQVVPDSVFSGTIAFVCPTNLPTNTTCTFSSPSVNVTAGTPAPFSVTFQTTGIINPLTSAIHQFPSTFWNLASWLLVLIFSISAFLLSQRRARRLALATLAATFALLCVALVGCKKGTSPASIGATPAGTYTMAVTGNSQNASRALTITLNVVQK